jgi:ABC-type spermidine/putrescine transport systems, ATPase components
MAQQETTQYETLLKVTDISKTFGNVRAVKNASLDVRKGEIVALIGPSGCGKTTILRMIAGFETPDSGEILLQGNPVTSEPPEKRDIGIVFQDYALFPHLDVIDNVRFAMPKVSKTERDERAAQMLSMLGLSGFENRFPDQLSGGQQQRVALARSFAASPRLLLLDEPFSNLDAALRQNTRREIRAILKSTGIGVVFVTHDQEEALSFADRICVMREGQIEQFGVPMQIYDQPANDFVATFLGRTNLIETVADGRVARTPLGEIELDRDATGPVQLSLRPEHLMLAPVTEGCDAAVVAYREFKGHDITYWVQKGGLTWQVDADYTHRFNPGARVQLIQRDKAVVLGKCKD